MVTALRDAASFLTRIPLHRDNPGVPDMSAAVPWFAIVGLLLGLVQGGLYVAVFELSTPVLAAAIATAALALITGAFHHDGLADMADAFGGGWTTEQRLEILKDSRLGTYGVTTLVFIIIIEVAALSALTSWLAVAATVTAHATSRAVSSMMMITAAPAKESGLGVDYLVGLSRSRVVATAAFMAAGAVALFGLAAFALLAAAYGSGLLVVRLAVAKIGGISGDVLGAVQQIAKVVVLIAIVIAAELTTNPGLLGGLALN